MNLKSQKGDVSAGILFLLFFIAILIWIFWDFLTSNTFESFLLVLLLIPCLYWIVKKYFDLKSFWRSSFWGWVTFILAIIVSIVIVWGISVKLNHPVLYTIIYVAILILSLTIMPVRKYLRRNAGKNVLGDLSQFQYVPNTLESNKNYIPVPDEPTLKEKTLTYIRQFKPNWRMKKGKLILEGGENGNNANLAIYLRQNGLNVETEETLSNGSRADLIINDEMILECKPELKSTDTLHKLSGEVKRARKITKYQVYALIYGDARKDLYKELCDDIGEHNVILLGKLVDS